MNTVKCPDCGTEYSSSANECPRCGCPNDNKPEEPTNEGMICPECGMAIDSSMTSCPNCGHPLNNNIKFTRSSLLPGEEILCAAKWHWINYLLYVFFVLASLVFLFLWIYNLDWDVEIAWSIYFPLFLVLGLCSAIGIISIEHNEFTVTNLRIIIKCGIIRRASYELKLDKLESVQVYQGIIGRLLGYGSVLVHGVGASRQLVWGLESPLEFRQHIFDELSKNSVDNN